MASPDSSTHALCPWKRASASLALSPTVQLASRKDSPLYFPLKISKIGGTEGETGGIGGQLEGVTGGAFSLSLGRASLAVFYGTGGDHVLPLMKVRAEGIKGVLGLRGKRGQDGQQQLTKVKSQVEGCFAVDFFENEGHQGTWSELSRVFPYFPVIHSFSPLTSPINPQAPSCPEEHFLPIHAVPYFPSNVIIARPTEACTCTFC